MCEQRDREGTLIERGWRDVRAFAVYFSGDYSYYIDDRSCPVLSNVKDGHTPGMEPWKRMLKRACVILPTYNEVENIRIVIPLIFEQSARLDTHELHVLVVDDNSPDGTGDAVTHLMEKFSKLHLITGEKRGLGEAYKRGMAWAIKNLEPDLIFEMDADLQHDPGLIPLFITLANHGFSLVIGSRFAPGGSTPDFSLRRKLLSYVGNWMIRFFGGLPRIHDCTSGYRCIKSELIAKCDLSFLSTRGYSFQASLLCELLRRNAKIVEIPIVFPDRLHGESKLTLRDQVEFLINIAKIRFTRSAEFVKFCVVGSSGVLVNMGLYLLFTRLMGISMEIASPPAIEVSIISNFFWNNFWTFRDRDTQNGWRRRLLYFHLASGAAGVTNYASLLFLARVAGLSDVISNLIGIGAGTLINYFINSLWTWEKKRAGAPSPN
jgi:dolichol-phosphate mannosyltransferase